MRTPATTMAAGLVSALLATLGLLLGDPSAGAQPGSPPAITFVMDQILGPSALRVVVGVEPAGEPATAFVRYGETAAYGRTSPRLQVAAGLQTVKLTWQLAGLHRSTTYHLQVVAANAVGQVVTPDMTIEMPATPTPSAPVAPPASAPPAPVPPAAPSAPSGAADEVGAVPVSTATGAFSSLNDVSCTTTTFCLAVGVTGTSVTHWRPLVERFGGRTFSLLASPAPWGAQLQGVACHSSAFCLAVGADGNDAFSERWNGKGWRVLSTPSPRLDGGDQLVTVACVSVADCFGVGVENGGTKDARPLVEHWNGAAWSLVPTPSVPGAVLESLSCPSAASCFVVGIADSASGLGRPLVEHWNGHSFALSPAPPIGGQLFSVSCGGPASCVAVGNGGGTSLLLELAGGSWRVSQELHRGTLGAVACASPSSCFAVGGITAHWNGRAWMLGRPAAAPSSLAGGAQEAELQGLSCPTPVECVGVGALVHPTTGPGSVLTSRALADLITAPASSGG